MTWHLAKPKHQYQEVAAYHGVTDDGTDVPLALSLSHERRAEPRAQRVV